MLTLYLPPGDQYDSAHAIFFNTMCQALGHYTRDVDTFVSVHYRVTNSYPGDYQVATHYQALTPAAELWMLANMTSEFTILST